MKLNSTDYVEIVDFFELHAYDDYVDSEYNHTLYLHTRVLGGAAAATGQFPFMAFIIATVNNAPTYCGGALLSSTWVLTAAQCVDG
jgi:secreted trypsin-like serine protease